jgi:hypothetical protein|tara:strand:+ start:26444 stop:26575 length:132 start_codon:yes stop_codon:yes gene_type:complete
MAISNQIFEHFRSEEKKIQDAITLLKENGYRIYKTIEQEQEVV